LKLTVIVTVYNEKNTILEAIRQAKDLKIDKEIIVVDNCSTDGTRELLKSLNDDSVKIVYQPQNYGFGQSVLTGAALASGEFIYVQYSDLEYDIECVYRMLDVAQKENLDVVFGSRLYDIKKGFFSSFRILKQRPYYLGTLITTFLINIFYSKKFTDIIGVRLYRASGFKKFEIESRYMGFDFEVVSRVCKSGFRVKEVPVSYKPRKAREGKKIKVWDILPALKMIFKVKFFDKK